MGWLEPAASRKLKPTALTPLCGLKPLACFLRLLALYAYLWHAVTWGVWLSPDRRCAPQSGVMDKLAPPGQ